MYFAKELAPHDCRLVRLRETKDINKVLSGGANRHHNVGNKIPVP
jgi:hypothetical protein